MNLIFATNNQHKIDEVKAALPDSIKIRSLNDAEINIDIPEPFDTLHENAREKARTIFKLTKTNCFSEDTGLEVLALNGEPGVHSARYAGEERSPEKNIEKLLQKLQDSKNRDAQFRAVICLILDDKEYFFEGICTGIITTTLNGSSGFGYDPVFIPDGAQKSFAEMTIEEKNVYNHRRKAVDKLVMFLKQVHENQ